MGEASACAPLRAARAQGVGSLEGSLIFYLHFSTAQICQQDTTVLKLKA